MPFKSPERTVRQLGVRSLARASPLTETVSIGITKGGLVRGGMSTYGSTSRLILLPKYSQGRSVVR